MFLIINFTPFITIVVKFRKKNIIKCALNTNSK